MECTPKKADPLSLAFVVMGVFCLLPVVSAVVSLPAVLVRLQFSPMVAGTSWWWAIGVSAALAARAGMGVILIGGARRLAERFRRPVSDREEPWPGEGVETLAALGLAVVGFFLLLGGIGRLGNGFALLVKPLPPRGIMVAPMPSPRPLLLGGAMRTAIGAYFLGGGRLIRLLLHRKLLTSGAVAHPAADRAHTQSHRASPGNGSRET